MLNVVKLDLPNPQERLMEVLENLLVRAESGELQDIAYVGLLSDGDVTSGTTPTVDRVKQLGALSLLQDLLVKSFRVD